MKQFGCFERNKDYWPTNFIILITKRSIYWCSKRGFVLNIYFLQKEIKRIFDEQRLLANIALNENCFLNKWHLWIELFDTVPEKHC